MNSTLKVHTSERRTLIEKTKAEIRKRAEAKARRMLLKARPKDR
jgi:vacuolar-type H+-ATPase subunit H